MKSYYIVFAFILFSFIFSSECKDDLLERSYCFKYNYCLNFLAKTLSFIQKGLKYLTSSLYLNNLFIIR